MGASPRYNHHHRQSGSLNHSPLAMSETSLHMILYMPASAESLDNSPHILVAIIEIISSCILDDRAKENPTGTGSFHKVQLTF